MAQWSNPAILWMHISAAPRWRTLPRFPAFLAVALLGAGPLPAIAAALTCGEKPDVTPVEFRDELDSETKSTASSILSAKPPVDVRKLVGVQRNELRHAFVHVDPLLVDGYLLWTTCMAISNNPNQSASDKFDRYADMYRLLSEPVKAGAHAE